MDEKEKNSQEKKLTKKEAKYLQESQDLVADLTKDNDNPIDKAVNKKDTLGLVSNVADTGADLDVKLEATKKAEKEADPDSEKDEKNVEKFESKVKETAEDKDAAEKELKNIEADVKNSFDKSFVKKSKDSDERVASADSDTEKRKEFGDRYEFSHTEEDYKEFKEKSRAKSAAKRVGDGTSKPYFKSKYRGFSRDRRFSDIKGNVQASLHGEDFSTSLKNILQNFNCKVEQEIAGLDTKYTVRKEQISVLDRRGEENVILEIINQADSDSIKAKEQRDIAIMAIDKELAELRAWYDEANEYLRDAEPRIKGYIGNNTVYFENLYQIVRNKVTDTDIANNALLQKVKILAEFNNIKKHIEKYFNGDTLKFFVELREQLLDIYDRRVNLNDVVLNAKSYGITLVNATIDEEEAAEGYESLEDLAENSNEVNPSLNKDAGNSIVEFANRTIKDFRSNSVRVISYWNATDLVIKKAESHWEDDTGAARFLDIPDYLSKDTASLGDENDIAVLTHETIVSNFGATYVGNMPVFLTRDDVNKLEELTDDTTRVVMKDGFSDSDTIKMKPFISKGELKNYKAYSVEYYALDNSKLEDFTKDNVFKKNTLFIVKNVRPQVGVTTMDGDGILTNELKSITAAEGLTMIVRPLHVQAHSLENLLGEMDTFRITKDNLKDDGSYLPMVTQIQEFNERNYFRGLVDKDLIADDYKNIFEFEVDEKPDTGEQGVTKIKEMLQNKTAVSIINFSVSILNLGDKLRVLRNVANLHDLKNIVGMEVANAGKIPGILDEESTLSTGDLVNRAGLSPLFKNFFTQVAGINEKEYGGNNTIFGEFMKKHYRSSMSKPIYPNGIIDAVKTLRKAALSDSDMIQAQAGTPFGASIMKLTKEAEAQLISLFAGAKIGLVNALSYADPYTANVYKIGAKKYNLEKVSLVDILTKPEDYNIGMIQKSNLIFGKLPLYSLAHNLHVVRPDAALYEYIIQNITINSYSTHAVLNAVWKPYAGGGDNLFANDLYFDFRKTYDNIVALRNYVTADSKSNDWIPMIAALSIIQKMLGLIEVHFSRYMRMSLAHLPINSMVQYEAKDLVAMEETFFSFANAKDLLQRANAEFSVDEQFKIKLPSNNAHSVSDKSRESGAKLIKQNNFFFFEIAPIIGWAYSQSYEEVMLEGEHTIAQTVFSNYQTLFEHLIIDGVRTIDSSTELSGGYLLNDNVYKLRKNASKIIIGTDRPVVLQRNVYEKMSYLSPQEGKRNLFGMLSFTTLPTSSVYYVKSEFIGDVAIDKNKTASKQIQTKNGRTVIDAAFTSRNSFETTYVKTNDLQLSNKVEGFKVNTKFRTDKLTRVLSVYGIKSPSCESQMLGITTGVSDDMTPDMFLKLIINKFDSLDELMKIDIKRARTQSPIAAIN